MSLVLDTGTMKYRQNPNQPWRPLVIKAGMNWESMADTYDPDNGTYEVGQYVLEEGMMYRCISEITTPEAWTPAHWTSVNVGDELSSFIIISDDQPTDETNKIWIAETTAPFGVQIPTMDDHIALGNTLLSLEDEVETVENGIAVHKTGGIADESLLAGKFIHLTNSGNNDLPDGFYQVKSGGIVQGDSYSTSNLTNQENEDGIANTMQTTITSLPRLYRTIIGTTQDVTSYVDSMNNGEEFLVYDAGTTGAPTTGAGMYLCIKRSGSIAWVFAFVQNTYSVYYKMKYTNWSSSWKSITFV